MCTLDAWSQKKQRFKIVFRRGAYHGVTSMALRALGTVLPMRHTMEPLTPGSVFVESPYCYRCPLHLHYPDCDLACARDVARIIEFEGPDQVSALIGEPIQQGFGALFPINRLLNLIQRAQEKGLLIKLMGQAIELAPPLVITREDIDKAIAILHECVREEAGDMGLG